ncbi:MAG: hypothetical protein QM811_14660 [Pirellulales bacterium]
MSNFTEPELIFGLLAQRLGWISRDQLLAGTRAWIVNKSVPPAEHLVRLGVLSPERRRLLGPLVDEQLRANRRTGSRWKCAGCLRFARRRAAPTCATTT